MTLLTLKNGQEAKISTLNEQATCYQRLLEVGCTQGETITVLRKAPFKGPLQVQIRNASYAIPRQDAAHIHIQQV